jgi:hypothetical protein
VNGHESGDAIYFHFGVGGSGSTQFNEDDEVAEALCVRGSGPRDRAEREGREQEKAAEAEQQRRQEAARGVWTDPRTSLMWTIRDNGYDVGWSGAIGYCRMLGLGGYSDWRLPGIDELEGIMDPATYANGQGIKPEITVSGWEWSATQGDSQQALTFFFNFQKRGSYPFDYQIGGRALCVRRP